MNNRLTRRRKKTILGADDGSDTTHARRPSQTGSGEPMPNPIPEQPSIVGDDSGEHHAPSDEAQPAETGITARQATRPILWIVVTGVLAVGLLALVGGLLVVKNQGKLTEAKLGRAVALLHQYDEANKQMAERAKSQDSALAALTETGKKLADRNVELTTDLDAKGKGLDETMIALTASREEAGRLKGLVTAAQEKIAAADRERTQQQIRLEEQARQLSRVSAELRERGDEMQQVRAELAKSEATARDAESRVRIAQDTLANLTKDRDAKVAEIADLNNRIEELKKLVIKPPKQTAGSPALSIPAAGRPRPPILPPTDLR